MAEQCRILASQRSELVKLREGLRASLDYAKVSASESSLSHLLDNMHNLVLRRSYLTDHGQPQMLMFFGADVEALLGRPGRPPFEAGIWYERIHPADRTVYLEAEAARQGRAAGAIFDFRFSGVAVPGLRWARETAGKPVEMQPGVWLLDSYIQDITEQKRLEEDLRASERSYRAVVEDQAEYIRRLDRQGRLTFVNQAFCRLLARSREELIGVHLLDLLPVAAGRQVRRRLASLSALQPTVTYEQSVVQPGGAPGWQEWTDRAICDETGEIREYQSVGRDITERKLAERQARYLLQHDPLTDLPNRALLEAHLRQALRQAARRRRRAALLLIDLDGFKQINDSHGHLVGDQLLRVVGRRLRGSLRGSDLVARIGGDEFAVILVGVEDGATAQALADKLVAVLAQPFMLAGEPLPLAASIGVGVFPDHAREPMALLRAADIALYRAKAEGRNAARLYAPSMAAAVAARRALERDLRGALQQGEIELFYQPRLDLRSQRNVAVEALARWHRPGHAIVPPVDFLDVAEDIGLSLKLDCWAIEQAWQRAGRWFRAGLVRRVAVNLSARQASEPRLVSELARISERTGLPPESLELELTEHAVIDAGSALTADCLRRISDLGITLAIDDFGSGFSSFAYLRRLPVQTIKIDGSFIGRIGEDARDETIIKAIIELCHALGKRVVAEGVETTRQLAFLTAQGCDEAQGYLFSRPQPALETEAYLAQPWPLAPRIAVAPDPRLATANGALIA